MPSHRSPAQAKVVSMVAQVRHYRLAYDLRIESQLDLLVTAFANAC
jgi:hypothetical protein